MAEATNAKLNKVVPDIVVGRLPLYLRTLIRLEEEGKIVTSSQELATRLGFSSAQIRKDLSHFGEFGKQGTGYNIAYLMQQLKNILNLDAMWDVAVVGIGDLGHALARYGRFSPKGFRISALFDADPRKIGTLVDGISVQSSDHLVEAIRASSIRIAILAVPLAVAQETAEKLVEAGVQAILNYAPTTLIVPPSVKVQNIDPIAHLQKMTYYCEH